MPNARPRALSLAFFFALGSIACSKGDASSKADAGPGSRSAAASPAAQRDPLAPPTQASRPTTDGAIAIGNLSAQIRGTEAAIAHNPRVTGLQGRLFELVSL